MHYPAEELTTIYACVTYKLSGEARTKFFGANVPIRSTMGERIISMSSLAREHIIPKTAKSGTLIFRLDWSHKPLTIWQAMQDWIYHNTMCGTQHTGRHWIPIIPPPPFPPPAPVNRRTVRGSAAD